MSNANGRVSDEQPSTQSSKGEQALDPPRDDAKKDAETSAEFTYALVVDDEPANRDFLVRLLQQAQLDVKDASTASEARARLAEGERVDLIVIDNRLPDGDGVDLMAELHMQFPGAHMVMATMLDDRPLVDKAFANGCDVFLVKPHGFMELFRRIQIAKTTGKDTLSQVIIDQYGPRPYRS